MKLCPAPLAYADTAALAIISPIITQGTVSPSSRRSFPSPEGDPARVLAGNSSRPFAPARLTVRLERCPPVVYARRPVALDRTHTRWYSARGSSRTGEVSCGASEKLVSE